MKNPIIRIVVLANLLLASMNVFACRWSSDSCAVDTLPWSEGFESFGSRIDCWTFVDADGDGYGWTNEMNPLFEGHNSSSSIASASYIQGVGALRPNNWLISPEIELPAGQDITLSWFEKSQDPSYITEHYSVYISTTGANPSDFGTPIFSNTISSSGWAQQSVSLNAYRGQTVRIAFRHHNSANHYWLVIDDIRIDAESDPTANCTLLSNDSEMGEVSGGGTYTLGESITISATATAHHHFVAWDDGNRENPRTLFLTQDTVLTALFGIDTFQIQIVSNDLMRGNVTGSGEYAYGAMVEATATAYTGYAFAGWDNGIGVTPYTFGASADLTLTALFVPEDSLGISEATVGRSKITTIGRTICVNNVADEIVRVYSASGGLVSIKHPQTEEIEIEVKASGVYLIQVGERRPQRVIVVK